jgi:hypothetical protein
MANINRGSKDRSGPIMAGGWEDMFVMLRGDKFAIRSEFTDDEARDAWALCDAGATPMQAAIELYGRRGKYARVVQGTNPDLKLVSDADEARAKGFEKMWNDLVNKGVAGRG